MVPQTIPEPSGKYIIAIDPGYDRCGVAVLSGTSSKPQLVSSLCITTNKRDSYEKRLLLVGREVSRILSEYKPLSCGLEQLYFTNNQKTAMRVAEVRGVLLYILTDAGVPVFEYTPSQIKLAVSGWGRSDKKQITRILPQLLHINKNIAYDDEYDAIAVGITHLASQRMH